MHWDNVNIFTIPTGARGRVRATTSDGVRIDLTGTATGQIRFLHGILRRQFVDCVCHHQGDRRYSAAWLGHNNDRLTHFQATSTPRRITAASR